MLKFEVPKTYGLAKVMSILYVQVQHGAVLVSNLFNLLKVECLHSLDVLVGDGTTSAATFVLCFVYLQFLVALVQLSEKGGREMAHSFLTLIFTSGESMFS